MSDRLTVVVVPPPTANGPLHLGHLSGPYLGADLVARAARSRGERVLAVGGIDVHQNYVLAMAEERGVDVDKLIEDFRGRIADAYALGRIRTDVDVDPLDPAHQARIVRLLDELIATGAIAVRETTLHRCDTCERTLHHVYVAGTCGRCGATASGGSCEGCGGFTSAQNLVDPVCTRCGATPTPFRATVPVLRLSDVRDRLTQVWTRGTLSTRVRDLVAGYLTDGLPDIPVAYPSNWGVRYGALRLDVYFELALSNFLTVARAVDPHADGLAKVRAAWSRVDSLWHVNGIDNAFYFAMLWPAAYLVAGASPEQIAGTVVNEFFTLDGAKFSTSRDHAIWADEFLADENPLLVRLFLAWQRPGSHSTDFTLAGYERFCAWVRPLLTNAAPNDTAGVDAYDEVIRGLQALEPTNFDPALSVRCLTNALSAGATADELLRILGGTS